MLLPMPEEAPVMTIVLPSRRFVIAEAIVRDASLGNRELRWRDAVDG